VKADQKARGRFLGGSIPFGYRLGVDGGLVPHESEQAAIAEMVAMNGQGRSLRDIAAEMQAKGHQISHVGVQSALKARQAVRLAAIRRRLAGHDSATRSSYATEQR